MPAALQSSGRRQGDASFRRRFGGEFPRRMPRAFCMGATQHTRARTSRGDRDAGRLARTECTECRKAGPPRRRA
ncbi:hypothetical protein C7S16_1622 [Burkholderia thailandensis]|uniref:Uncharacterized protein n=1 Tax=Burkholderia thailandensis TaxID=57975 RepID=A0AAW9D190_BURTH|nr:hypothetical protein [Burkholderia thailandensis]